jgi:predicted transcriptional regulator of viral defense system
MAQSADWALSRGIGALTTAQVGEAFGIPVSQVPERMSAPKRRVEWIAPARGLWIPVAPEFRGWGGPPAAEFIGPLMAHLGVEDYYIGWLTAAAVFGAAHQAPQVTHVATSRLVRPRQVGRVQLVFHERSRIGALPTVERTGRSGRYRVSSPEVTAFDVASDITVAGGLDNVATVVVDLTEETGLDDQTLTRLAPLFPAAAVRRVGWIIESHTSQRLDVLAAQVAASSTAPARLHPAHPMTGSLDARWRLRLNTTVNVE